jgi:hypothetical protein
MRLVDDDRVVGGERAVRLRLGQQDAVGHQLDVRVGPTVVGEADFVADRGAELDIELLGNARGDAARGDTPRLRVADQAARAAPELQTDFRDLRRLAGSGFAADDDHLMLPNRRRDPLARFGHRQFGWIGDGGAAVGAARDTVDRRRDRLFEPVLLCRRGSRLQPVNPAAERNPVAGHAGAKPPSQLGDRRRGRR